MIPTLELLSPAETQAVADTLKGESTTVLAASGATKLLKNIAIKSEELQLAPADVLGCFAEVKPALSAEGAFYKLTSWLLGFVGTIGTTGIIATGVGATLWLIKKGVSSAFSALSSAVANFAGITTPGGGAAQAVASSGEKPGLWSRLYHAVFGDELRDGPAMDPSMFAMGLATAVPAPVSYLINQAGGVFEGLSGGTIATPGAPAAPATNAPPAFAPTGPAPAAPTGGGGLGGALASVAAPVLSAAGSALGSWLSGVLKSDEVRDELRDSLPEDLARIGTYLHAKYGISVPEEMHSGAPVGLE